MTSLVFAAPLSRWGPSFCSLLAVIIAVKTIWQACQVSPAHSEEMADKEGATCEANYSSFPISFHSTPNRKASMKTLAAAALTWPMFMRSLIFTSSFSSFLHAQDCKKVQGNCFSATAARHRGLWRRASSQLLDKISMLATNQMQSCGTVRGRRCSQSCRAVLPKMRFLSVVNSCFHKMRHRAA